MIKIERKLNKKKAMTLAEILITLGIIGVVAAFTIPTLMNKTQDAELKTAFKKAYSVVNQAYQLATLENGGGFGPVTQSTPQSWVKYNALKSQLKVVQDCPYNANAKGKCWSNSGVGLKDWQVTSCGAASNNIYQNNNASFVTADGMFWMLYTYSSTTGWDIIFVDVNGDKKPNDWGKDAFMFYMNDSNITPFSYTCAGNLKHNDGTVVDSMTEFSAPLLNNE